MKNYIKYYIIVFVCCILLFSCKDKRSTNDMFVGEIVSIDTKNTRELIEITSLADSVRYIKLETTNESIIGNITQVIFYDELFYIKDNQTASILIFDQTGKYKFKISNRGRGPGEYTEITRMLIDRKNGQILLYDINSRKMIYYTIEGKFVKEIHSFSEGATVRDVIQLPDGGFLCYEPYNDNENFKPDMKHWGVWKVDSAGKHVKHVWTTENTYIPIFNWNIPYFYELADNKIGLWCVDVNDVLHFSNDTVIYKMSMKIDKPTVSDYPGKTKKDIPSSFTVRTDVMEKDNFIFSQWWDKSKNYADIISLYLKKEKISLVASGIIYPKDSGFLQGKRVYFNCMDQMLEVISADELDRFDMLIEKGYRSDKEKAMLKSLFGNPDYDNPVLEIIYLKK